MSPAPGVPAPHAPLVVVVLAARPPVPPPATVAWEASWREAVLATAGRCGADLKQAVREALRLGGQTLVVWPQELGDWRAMAPSLLRPIFAQRAELVVSGWSPEAQAAGCRALPSRLAGRLLATELRLVHGGPLAVSRRALDVVPFEANSDGALAELQLLAQARHFGLETAAVPLPEDAYRALRPRSRTGSPGVAAQLLCGIELIMHRWGLIDAPRFQLPQAGQIGRWLVSNDRP